MKIKFSFTWLLFIHDKIKFEHKKTGWYQRQERFPAIGLLAGLPRPYIMVSTFLLFGVKTGENIMVLIFRVKPVKKEISFA